MKVRKLSIWTDIEVLSNVVFNQVCFLSCLNWHEVFMVLTSKDTLVRLFRFLTGIVSSSAMATDLLDLHVHSSVTDSSFRVVFPHSF